MTGNGDSKENLLKDGAIDLISGTLGGIANVYSGQPLDTVKVKVQAFPHLYKNWVVCLRDTFRIDGIRGLYAGTIPALAANIADNAVLFTAYGYCQKAVGLVTERNRVEEMTPLENASAGGLAAVFVAMALCPTELVKCRLQAAREMGKTSSSLGVCREIWNEKGIKGFFVGFAPTLSREVPGYFCFFGAYETSRYLFTKTGQSKDDIGLLRTAASGSLGGCALWTVTFPADVVKSRMQVTGEGRFLPILRNIIQHEGFRALYKGLLATLIRTSVASGCLFVTYEESKKFLNSIF